MSDKKIRKENKRCEELHIILLWPSARYKQDKIIDDVASKFKIFDIVDLRWDKEKFSRNMQRFYGISKHQAKGKISEAGQGNILVLLVVDNSPIYEYAETSRGTEYVNINLFQAKSLYRRWTGGGHKIHATNSKEEVDHDLTLLMGENTSDYIERNNSYVFKNIRSVRKDIVGSDDWQSLEHLFYVLNATTKYIVLRNFEDYPHEFCSKVHGDIDLLVANLQEASLIANSYPVFSVENRVHYYTYINGEKVFFDFRYQNDNYYNFTWETDMLNSRVFENGFYRPSLSHYFHSLVYHALIHKTHIVDDYHQKLRLLHKDLFGEIHDCNNSFSTYFNRLKVFMRTNGYFFTKPIDTSVFFDRNIVDIDYKINFIKNNCDIKDINPARMHDKRWGSGYVKFIGDYSGTRLLVKYGGAMDSVQREFRALRYLYSFNQVNFPKPYFYKFDKVNECDRFIAIQFIPGLNLKEIFDKRLLNNYNLCKISKQLFDICLLLNEKRVIHRDITPQNIIIDDDSNVILIDFQFVFSDEIDMFSKVLLPKHKMKDLSNLGEDYRKGDFLWDDAYSIWRILEKIYAISGGSNTVKVFQDKSSLMIGSLFFYDRESQAYNNMKYGVPYLCEFKVVRNLGKKICFFRILFCKIYYKKKIIGKSSVIRLFGVPVYKKQLNVS